jgi:hypothetical protein
MVWTSIGHSLCRYGPFRPAKAAVMLSAAGLVPGNSSRAQVSGVHAPLWKYGSMASTVPGT